jgi:hypothetical protein
MKGLLWQCLKGILYYSWPFVFFRADRSFTAALAEIEVDWYSCFFTPAFEQCILIRESFVVWWEVLLVRPRCEKSNQVLPRQAKFESRGCRPSLDLDAVRPYSGLSMGESVLNTRSGDSLCMCERGRKLCLRRLHARSFGLVFHYFVSRNACVFWTFVPRTSSFCV